MGYHYVATIDMTNYKKIVAVFEAKTGKNVGYFNSCGSFFVPMDK
jgi:hypothetical protein